MDPNILVLANGSVSPAVVARYRALCRALANSVGESVGLALQDVGVIRDLEGRLGGQENIEQVQAAPSTPTGAAPFLYRQDGKVDWAAMWTTFSQLAMFGGPPHRGDDNPVNVSYGSSDKQAEPDLLAELQRPVMMSSARRRARQPEVDVIWEIRRGIAETTGLYGKPYPPLPERPAWLGIMCATKKEAAWMSAAIVFENVDSWYEDTLLFVPCSSDFDLVNEVRSVINVVAKVAYYWEQHLISTGAYDPALTWVEHEH